MNYPSKVSVALESLAVTGLRRADYAPPLHRLLWRLGFNIPPPHFASFFTNFVAMGSYFGVSMGIFMWVYFWVRYGISPLLVLPLAVAAGLLFGASMAVHFRRGAIKYNLPSWSSLPGRAQT